MTKLLEEAFRRATQLPVELQDRIARRLSGELQAAEDESIQFSAERTTDDLASTAAQLLSAEMHADEFSDWSINAGQK